MFVCKLPLDGFNACLWAQPNGTFYATIRRQHVIAYKQYPEVLNDLLTFTMNSNFQLIDTPKLLQDIPGREKFKSYTEGIEDARIVNPGFLFAVACDTNPFWKPEVVAVSYDPITAKTLSIQPLCIQGFERSAEKNWLPLRRWQNEVHVLHWLNPLRVLRVNIQTGLAEVLVEYAKNDLLDTKSLHCGAALQIQEGFLIQARVRVEEKYSHSLWLLLDSDSYKVKGISNPFRFLPPEEANYEMCMSLTKRENQVLACDDLAQGRVPTFGRKDEEIIACVSISDTWSGVWKFSLSEILQGLRPVEN